MKQEYFFLNLSTATLFTVHRLDGAVWREKHASTPSSLYTRQRATAGMLENALFLIHSLLPLNTTSRWGSIHTCSCDIFNLV